MAELGGVAGGLAVAQAKLVREKFPVVVPAHILWYFSRAIYNLDRVGKLATFAWLGESFQSQSTPTETLMCKIDVFLPVNNTGLLPVTQTSLIGALFCEDHYLFAFADDTGLCSDGILMTSEQLRAVLGRVDFFSASRDSAASAAAKTPVWRRG